MSDSSTYKDQLKYLADALTGFRVIAAAAVVILIWQDQWWGATVMFIAGVLSDAFDGIAARKWPYTPEENRALWWRKDPHLFDNLADLTLSGAALVGLSFSQLDFLTACLVVAAVGLTSFAIQTVVDHIGPNNRSLAERIDVAHGWLYGAELATMLVLMTTLATPAWRWVTLGYAVVSLPLLWLKWDRITSRSELTYGA